MLIPNKQSSEKDVKSLIYRWNLSYPIDRWWREKHKVIFNSPTHRVVSFSDMYFEWMEDKIYKDELTAGVKNYDYKRGDWLTEQKETEESREMDIQDFENMDLSKFDE